MKRHLTRLAAGAALTLAGAGASQADMVVTWSDVGGELNLSIEGNWSTWESPTTLASTDSLLFDDNGDTPFAFELSRGNINGVGQAVILDVVSGSGGVTADDFFFGPPLPTTGYNLVHLNEGGLLALEAEVASTGTFTISESFDLGLNFSLTAGTRTFSLASAPGETLTMRYVTGSTPPPVGEEVPLPGALPLLAAGLGAFGLAEWRRRSRAS